jgi:hypothetical protein
MAWEVEFYDEEGGRSPVREFLADLEPQKRMAMIAAIEVVLGATRAGSLRDGIWASVG